MESHKLQYYSSRSRNGERSYEKYQVVLPTTMVQTAGWKPNETISFQTGPTQPDGKRKITLTATVQQTKVRKMTFEEFGEAVILVLRSDPKQEWTWTEISAANPNLPKKPHDGWVHRMEIECGLKRVKGPNGKIWQLDLHT